MRPLTVISVAILGCSFLTKPSCAQVTNPCPAAPATKPESFDANANVVILKATTGLGSVSANAGVVAVRCREVTDTRARDRRNRESRLRLRKKVG